MEDLRNPRSSHTPRLERKRGALPGLKDDVPPLGAPLLQTVSVQYTEKRTGVKDKFSGLKNRNVCCLGENCANVWKRRVNLQISLGLRLASRQYLQKQVRSETNVSNSEAYRPGAWHSRLPRQCVEEWFPAAHENASKQGVNGALKLRFFPTGAGIFDRASSSDSVRTTLVTFQQPARVR